MPLFLLETVQDGHETTYATTHHFFTTSHVIVGPTKIINYLLKDCKIRIFLKMCQIFVGSVKLRCQHDNIRMKQTCHYIKKLYLFIFLTTL